MGLEGFLAEGQTLFRTGRDTASSRVLAKQELDGLPAYRVEMIGQGFEMVWIQDQEDLYFLMYPTPTEKALADRLEEITLSFHVLEAQTPPVCDPADYRWREDGAGGMVLAAYVGNDVRVRVPESVEGKPVTAVGERAFYGTGVPRVELPDSVTQIGDFAFSGCNELRTLRLPQGLKAIPNGMLESCMRLWVAELPDSVCTIGDGAFWGNAYLFMLRLPAALETLGRYNFAACPSLQYFEVPEDCLGFKVDAQGTSLLSRDGKRLVRYAPYSLEKNYQVPEGVERIDPFALEGAWMLESVTLPENCREIGVGAFYGMPMLERLNIPADVVRLGVVWPSPALQVSSLESDAAAPLTASGESTVADTSVILSGEPGSPAETYAQRFGYTFVSTEDASENHT